MTENEMIERVARALIRATHNGPAENYGPGWIDSQVDKYWHLFVYNARVAIEATTEPTIKIASGDDTISAAAKLIAEELMELSSEQRVKFIFPDDANGDTVERSISCAQKIIEPLLERINEAQAAFYDATYYL